MDLYLKLDTDNETIIGHDYYSHDEYTTKIANAFVLVDNNGQYKYKYVLGELVELTKEEISNHPLTVKKAREEKINKMFYKQYLKKTWQEVLNNETLTAEETQDINDKITEADAIELSKQL